MHVEKGTESGDDDLRAWDLGVPRGGRPTLQKLHTVPDAVVGTFVDTNLDARRTPLDLRPLRLRARAPGVVGGGGLDASDPKPASHAGGVLARDDHHKWSRVAFLDKRLYALVDPSRLRRPGPRPRLPSTGGGSPRGLRSGTDGSGPAAAAACRKRSAVPFAVPFFRSDATSFFGDVHLKFLDPTLLT